MQLERHCSSVHCGAICSVMQALLTVDLPHVNIIAASCCFVPRQKKLNTYVVIVFLDVRV
jgi:hypothetical protein